MEGGVGAHRMADHVRLLDAEPIHDGDDVAAGDVLTVRAGSPGTSEGG